MVIFLLYIYFGVLTVAVNSILFLSWKYDLLVVINLKEEQIVSTEQSAVFLSEAASCKWLLNRALMCLLAAIRSSPLMKTACHICKSM